MLGGKTQRTLRPVGSPDKGCAPEGEGDLNLRIVQPLAHFVREKQGVDVLERITASAGLTLDRLDGKSNWASLEQVEAFLAGARELVEDDEEFKEACRFQFKESFGPMMFALRAVSPRMVYELGVKDHKMVSRIGRNEILSIGKNHIDLYYFSALPDSRLMCLLRQAQIVALPTLWNLPRAILTETSCIANGDDCCEYHLRWYQHRRWQPIAAGFGAGALVAVGLGLAGLVALPLWAMLPLSGVLAGYAFELRRTNRANLKIGEESNEALVQLAGDDAEARREILASQQREKDWNRLMEEQAAERDAELEKTVNRLQKIMKERDAALLGLSHDLKNPLAHLMMQVGYLKLMLPEGADEDTKEALREHLESMHKMDLLIAEMVDMVKSGSGIMTVKPEMIQTSQLVDQLRRRLAAYARGKNLSTNAFATREAPATIEMDRVVLDRVADNLLTNAVKYTDRGNVLVELDGKPGFLTIKVSDTGRGIEEEEKKSIFLPDGSDALKRAERSHGVGLSGVARLMDLVGGEIEVMSLPGKGTTFWVHFPVRMRSPDEKSTRPSAAPEPADIVGKVVTFRKSMAP